VDEVLMDHPAVAQAIHLRHAARRCSAKRSPPRSLLREGQTASERDIRDFVAARLADSRCRGGDHPRRDPKGATGKLQRIGLAAKLGLGG